MIVIIHTVDFLPTFNNVDAVQLLLVNAFASGFALLGLANNYNRSCSDDDRINKTTLTKMQVSCKFYTRSMLCVQRKALKRILCLF